MYKNSLDSELCSYVSMKANKRQHVYKNKSGFEKLKSNTAIIL